MWHPILKIQPEEYFIRRRASISKAKSTFARRRFALLFVERNVKAFGHQSLADVFDRFRATEVCVRYFLISPVRAISVGREKHLSPTHLLGRALEFFHHGLEYTTLFFCKTNDIFLLHGHLHVLEIMKERSLNRSPNI